MKNRNPPATAGFFVFGSWICASGHLEPKDLARVSMLWMLSSNGRQQVAVSLSHRCRWGRGRTPAPTRYRRL